ncbi:MAG: helix-turn-helix domain-containing protein [Patescibacteria group bacterium]|nr:helix-turn-helix domain-containing protein [Patescibacteria group bacterium]
MAPKQITVGGKLAARVWKSDVLPVLKGSLSTRKAAAILGVTPMTVSRWRRDYLG